MLAWVLVVFISGEVVRTHRAYLDMARKHSAEAERTREEETRRRISEERLKFAREVHDVIAHNISLINERVPSSSTPNRSGPPGACRDQAGQSGDPAGAAGDPRALRAVDRQRPALRPAGPLDELVAGVRSSKSTCVDVAGRPRPLWPPWTRPLTGSCRSVTNVVRHAQADTVTVSSDTPDGVSLRVSDDGQGAAVDWAAGTVPACGTALPRWRRTGRARSGGRVHGGGVAAG